MWYLPLFLLGLAIGSFFNVIAFRFKEGQFIFANKVVGGRSRCMHCKRTLAWYELVPLFSFLLQLGRCRSCGHRLSLEYPLVEFLAGLLLPLVAFYFFNFKRLDYLSLATGNHSFMLWGAVAIWSLIFLFLLLLSVIDYREYLIPDEIPYFLAAFGIVWVACLVFFSSSGGKALTFSGSFVGEYAFIFGILSNIWLNHLLGALAGALTIGAIFFLSRGRAIGFGDVILLGVLGFIFGWPDVVLILLLSFLIGAAVSVVLLIRRAKGMKDFVPFAPFIALSSLIVFFYGADILHWYFIVFNPFA
jgi:prepilin signal peptidase PulO-like enzyme (type II secretory pathway)